MRCQDFDGLDIARFDIVLRALERTTLPPYLGSTLRGALGHALKDAACVVEHGDCRRCPLLDTCAFPYLFETPVPPEIKELRGQTHAPLPFLLEPPLVENPVRRVWRVPAAKIVAAVSSANSGIQSANFTQKKSPEANRFGNAEAALDTRASVPQRQISKPASVVSSVVFPDRPRQFNNGDELRFGLVLVGRAIDYLPLFLHAISEMAYRGLGAGRASFDLKEVFLKGGRGERERIYSGASQGLSLPARIGNPLSELIAVRVAEQERLCENGPEYHPRQWVDDSSPAYKGRTQESRFSLLSPSRREGERKTGADAAPLCRPYVNDPPTAVGGIAGVFTQAQGSGGGGKPVNESIEEVIGGALSQLAQRATGSEVRNENGRCNLRLRFLTPARIRVKDDLQTGLSFQLLVRSLLRRVSMLAAVHGSGRMQLDYRGLIERAGSPRVVRSTLRWWDLERYTDRQETKLRVGGLIGEVEYEGRVIDEFMPLICAGELLGVGTGTSLGLGRYQISAGEERQV